MATIPLPDLHPSWCDVTGECTGTDALRARGVAESDIPTWDQDRHRSTVERIPVGEHGDVELELSLWNSATDITTDQPAGLDVAVSYRYTRLVVGFSLTASQIRHLRDAFDDYGRIIADAAEPTMAEIQRAHEDALDDRLDGPDDEVSDEDESLPI